MIKLVDLLKETIKLNTLNIKDNYISANNLSKKIEPNPEEIYDFGGGMFSPLWR